MKYAVIADIHGNYMALQHIIEDAGKNGAEAFIFAGDYCVSAPWPAEVADTLLQMKNAYIVRGNEEPYLYTPESDDGQFEISRWCKQQMNEEQIDWLNKLPEKLTIQDGEHCIHVTHKSEDFIGDIELKNFGSWYFAKENSEGPVSHRTNLEKINHIIDRNEGFPEAQEKLPEGIYIFGHSHIQWHKQIAGRLFINPGSAGIPLDCEEFGAPYTLLTIEKDKVEIEERRVKYSVDELIAKVKESSQYEEARIWSEIIFREWRYGREHLCFFLVFADAYANDKGDSRRPFAKETWEEAYQEWKGKL